MEALKLHDVLIINEESMRDKFKHYVYYIYAIKTEEKR